MIKRLSVLLSIVFLYGVATAAPIITNVTGTTTRTITGSALMNQNTAGWQVTQSQGSFEGASVESDGYTCIYGPCNLVTGEKLMGNKSLQQKSTSGGGASCFGGTQPWHMYGDVYKTSTGNDVYWRFYVKYTSSMSDYFSKVSYFKIGYMFDGTQYWDYAGPSGSPPTQINLKPYAISHYHNLPVALEFDEYHCFEGRATKSGGTSTVTMWIDGVFVATDSESSGDPDNPGIFIFPFTNSCVTSSVTTQGTSYVDGFAIGSQRINPAATIVLANGSNYSTATKVLQHPTTLSDTSISFTYSESGYAPETGATVASMSGTARYVFVIDNRGQISAAFPLSGGGEDTTDPTVTGFTIPSTSDSLTVSVSTFTASDNVGVTGYLLTESATTPSPSNPGWQGTAQTSYTFASEGSKTLYAWAIDAAGNISSSLNDSVTITLPTPDTCVEDAGLCTTEGDCTTNWPAYNWCSETSTCQVAACGTPILVEDFDDETYAGWYDDTTHSDSVAGGVSGNRLEWQWQAGDLRPHNNLDYAMRYKFTNPTDEMHIQFYVNFDSAWIGSGVEFHPHMFLISTQYDSDYQGPNASSKQLYIEFVSDVSSPYRVRPVFGFQDAYNVSKAITYNSGGTTTPTIGETLTESGGDAIGILADYTIASGSFAGGDAAGVFYVRMPYNVESGSWTDGVQIDGTASGSNLATINGTTDGMTSAGIDLSSITEARSTFKCNQGTVTPTPTFSECYSLGAGHWYSAALYKNSDYEITKGVDHKVDAYIKMNTIAGGVGQADGIFKMWIDDNLVFDYSNLIIITDAYSDMKWEHFILGPYIGNPPGGSPITQTMWVDELQVNDTAQAPVEDTPVMTAATVDGTDVSITTDVNTAWAGYDDNDCQITCSVAGTVNLSSATGSGTDWSLTGDTSIGYGDTCTMDCTLGADDIETTPGGTDMDSIADFGVQVLTEDTSTPSVTPPSEVINLGADFVTITGTCSDDQLVSGAKWGANVQPDATTGTACTGTTSWSCDVTGLSRGANDVYVGCYDAADNYGLGLVKINSGFAQRYNGGSGGRGISRH